MTTNAENAQLVEGGTPDPATFRIARPVPSPFNPDQNGPLSATVASAVLLPIAGALLVRFRGKMTAGGTLHFGYRRSPPNHATEYSASAVPPCADLVVVANTEFVQDINPGGESVLGVTWTPDGANAATVTFFDTMQQ